MFHLYPLEERLEKSGDLMLAYKRDFDGDNHEWRDCVARFVMIAESTGIDVSVVNFVEFEPFEDFVNLTYSFDGAEIVFSNDACLGLILVWSKSREVLDGIWQTVGKQVGWVK